jgi:8-oxo-dGTP diphosphatase
MNRFAACPGNSETLCVVAGVIRDQRDRVLIAKRPDHIHQGGLWEFPGGKIEAGETQRQALEREIKEELDLDLAPDGLCPLIAIAHDYPDRRVRLYVWTATEFRGEARGMLGQEIQWVMAEELPSFAFPAANRPIVAAARLPDRYALVNVDATNQDEVKARLECLGNAGISLARLRTVGPQAIPLGAEVLRDLVVHARCLGIGLLIDGDPSLAVRAQSAGLHLRASELMASRQRPLGADYWVAASCHNQMELAQAVRIGLDFAVLGPVAPTASHLGANPLGWEAFEQLVDQAALPVYALGGLGSADTAEAKKRGAQGVAAIRGFLTHPAK